MTSAANSDNTPNVRATVAPPWLRVTRPDRSRAGSRAPPAHTVAPTATGRGDWAYPRKWSRAQLPASQAAAPDSACDGPIMTPVTPPRSARQLWQSGEGRSITGASTVECRGSPIAGGVPRGDALGVPVVAVA